MKGAHNRSGGFGEEINCPLYAAGVLHTDMSLSISPTQFTVAILQYMFDVTKSKNQLSVYKHTDKQTTYV